jgi:hypothetical protein
MPHRHVLDAAAAATALATMTKILPPIAALFSILWTLYQFYSSPHFQRFLKRQSDRRNSIKGRRKDDQQP